MVDPTWWFLARYLLPKTATAKIEPLSYGAAAYPRLFKQCNQKKIKCLNAFATFFLFKLMTKGSNNIAKRSFLFQVKKKNEYNSFRDNASLAIEGGSNPAWPIA